MCTVDLWPSVRQGFYDRWSILCIPIKKLQIFNRWINNIDEKKTDSFDRYRTVGIDPSPIVPSCGQDLPFCEGKLLKIVHRVGNHFVTFSAQQVPSIPPVWFIWQKAKDSKVCFNKPSLVWEKTISMRTWLDAFLLFFIWKVSLTSAGTEGVVPPVYLRKKLNV